MRPFVFENVFVSVFVFESVNEKKNMKEAYEDSLGLLGKVF